MWDKIKKQINNLKQKPMLIYGIGCLLLFCFAFFVIYYVRVIYSPQNLSQISGSLVLFFILFAVAFFAVLSGKIAKNNTALLMSCLIFISGVVFCFVNPPNQAPDEQSHYLRSYAMAMGDFQYDENQVWPNDVNLLIDYFHTAHNNGYPAKEGNTVANRFEEFYTALNSGEKGEGEGIIIFQTVPYLPSALGIFIARLFNFDALGCYYFGRIFNLIFYCVCCFFALKWADRFKIVLFSLMAMPLTVFMAASCNTDSFLFALMFLMFGAVLSENFDRKKAAIFALSFAVLCTSKMSYIVFLPLIWAVNKENWNINLKKYQYFIAVVSVFVAVYFLSGLNVSLMSNYGEIPRTMSDSNPAAQLQFILSNPLRYLAVFADTLKNNAFLLFSGGLFGWIDADIRLISYLTPIILLINTFKFSPNIEKRDLPKVIIFFITMLLTYGVVLTGMYLSWTPVTLPQIIGLQMRYVLPGFLGIILPLAYWAKGYTKPMENKNMGVMSSVYTCFVFTLCAAALLFMEYYLPVKGLVYVA